ncbi:MAG TPA: hypothetical protein VHX11_07200 [Acidobacteriaceae bacterium]|jgi:hypothetical protein|nr:hypothetical protein [Acidobacteriaceae bacterium]
MLKWRNTSWLTLSFAMLLCAVFAWGLKYKLSLYDSPHAISHRMPEAKLLSNQERVGYALPALVSEAAVPHTAVLPWSIGLLLTFSASLALLLKPSSLSRGLFPYFAGPPVPRMRAASFTSFFFRPPPRA